MEEKKIVSIAITSVEHKSGEKDSRPWRVTNVTSADGTKYSYFHPSKRDKAGNFISFYDTDPFLDSLVEGKTVKCCVEDKQKGEYVNHYLSPVRQIDLQEERILACEKDIASLRKVINTLIGPTKNAAEAEFGPTDGPPDNSGIDIEDVPF